MIQNQESRQSNTRLLSLMRKRERKSLPKLSQPWPGRFTPNFVPFACTKNETKSIENNKIQKVASTKFLQPITKVKGTSEHERMELKPEQRRIISYFEVSESSSLNTLQSYKKSLFQKEKQNVQSRKKEKGYMVCSKQYESFSEKEKWAANEDIWKQIMQKRAKYKIILHK